jgi:hypothetical protein
MDNLPFFSRLDISYPNPSPIFLISSSESSNVQYIPESMNFVTPYDTNSKAKVDFPEPVVPIIAVIVP